MTIPEVATNKDIDNRLAVQSFYSLHYPKEFQDAYINRAIFDFKDGLADYLWKNRKQRVCVTIREKTDYFGDQASYTITCDVTAVREYPVVMTMPVYQEMSWQALSGCAIDEMKHRIRKWFRGAK